MKRIALITYEFPPDRGKGGISTYMTNISEVLADAGWEVEVFSSSPTRTEIEISKKSVIVNWVRSDEPFDFQSKVLLAFEKRHSIKPFDLIESAEIHANAKLIKLKYQVVPLIVRLHCPDCLVESLKKINTPFFIKMRFFLGALRRGKWDLGYWKRYDKVADKDYQFIKMAQIISAPSEAMKTWACENWRIEERYIHVFPNPFSMPTCPIKRDSKTASKVIIFFGRLNVLKGLIPLTKAMKKVLLEHRDWKWRIIGDNCASHIPGTTMRDWMLMNLKGLEGQLEWYDGQQYEELIKLISDGEIAVLPSYFESYSYSCVEAMAAKLVVVGSKNGGMVDLLKKGAGVLINPFSATEIQNSLDALIKDDDLRLQFKERAAVRLTQLNNNKLKRFYNQAFRTFNVLNIT